MAINGRINVDVLFHDTDGTTSLKVVSLEDSTEYTTGKVAIVTGTCGTTAVTVFEAGNATPYKDASGAAVTFASSEVKRVAVSSPQQIEVFVEGSDSYLFSASGRVAVGDTPGSTDFMTVRAYPSGTASYTLVIYGT